MTRQLNGDCLECGLPVKRLPHLGGPEPEVVHKAELAVVLTLAVRLGIRPDHPARLTWPRGRAMKQP